MSKIILKVGPSTERVEQEQIKSISFGESPRTTIKYASNGSVVFFDRNPYYATITEPHETQGIVALLKKYEESDCETPADFFKENFQKIHIGAK